MQIPNGEQPNKVLTLPLWHQGTKKGQEELRVPRVGISPAGRKIRWSIGVRWSVRRRLDLETIGRERSSILRDVLHPSSGVMFSSEPGGDTSRLRALMMLFWRPREFLASTCC